MGLGGEYIVGQVLHVKNTQLKHVLDDKIQADERFLNEIHIWV